MPRGNFGVIHRADDIERQAEFWILRLGWQRDSQAQQGVEQLTLCQFHTSPEQEIPRVSQRWDGAVLATRHTQCFLGMLRQQPVADLMLEAVGAEFHRAVRQQPIHPIAQRIVARRMLTLQAFKAAEEENVTALAGESLHDMEAAQDEEPGASIVPSERAVTHECTKLWNDSNLALAR